jgi:hypothetical protein
MKNQTKRETAEVFVKLGAMVVAGALGWLIGRVAENFAKQTFQIENKDETK